MQAPHITTAIPRRRYRLGGYQAVLLADIESPDAARYRYIFALVKEGESRPSFYVTCEKNPRKAQGRANAAGDRMSGAAQTKQGSHRLRVISTALDEELESADRFEDEEAFAAEALSVAADLLGLRETPERLS